MDYINFIIQEIAGLSDSKSMESDKCIHAVKRNSAKQHCSVSYLYYTSGSVGTFYFIVKLYDK